MLKFMMTVLICTLLVGNPCSSIVKSDTYFHHLYTVYNVLHKRVYAFAFTIYYTSILLLDSIQVSPCYKCLMLQKEWFCITCMYIVNFCHEYNIFLHCYNVAFINQIKDL